MHIFLWKFKPPKGSVKRRSRLSQGHRPTLTDDTGTSLQRTAMHNVDTSTKNPFLQDVFQFGQPAHSCPFVMYRHALVCTCLSRAFPALLAIHERRGVA